MPTGLEAYHALRCRTRELDTFEVNSVDSKDLFKLTASDLESVGFGPAKAELISSDLMHARLLALSEAMGVTISVNPHAPSIFESNQQAL